MCYDDTPVRDGVDRPIALNEACRNGDIQLLFLTLSEASQTPRPEAYAGQQAPDTVVTF